MAKTKTMEVNGNAADDAAEQREFFIGKNKKLIALIVEWSSNMKDHQDQLTISLTQTKQVTPTNNSVLTPGKLLFDKLRVETHEVGGGGCVGSSAVYSNTRKEYPMYEQETLEASLFFTFYNKTGSASDFSAILIYHD